MIEKNLMSYNEWISFYESTLYFDDKYFIFLAAERYILFYLNLILLIKDLILNLIFVNIKYNNIYILIS